MPCYASCSETTRAIIRRVLISAQVPAAPEVPEDPGDQHHVAAVDEIQPGIGDHHQNGVVAELVLAVGVLIEVIAAVVQRMIDLDALGGDHLTILHDLQLADVVADHPAVAHFQRVIRIAVSGHSLEDVPSAGSLPRLLDRDLQGRIGPARHVVGDRLGRRRDPS